MCIQKPCYISVFVRYILKLSTIKFYPVNNFFHRNPLFKLFLADTFSTMILTFTDLTQGLTPTFPQTYPHFCG